MKREYLDDPAYNYEAVNRASKACGPLVKWAIAQVCMSFSELIYKACYWIGHFPLAVQGLLDHCTILNEVMSSKMKLDC